MKNLISTLTKDEAALVIRDRAASYVEEYGSDHTHEAFTPWAEELGESIGAELDEGHLADVVFAMETVESVEKGTHPAIRLNRAGTVDNRDSVFAYEDGLLARYIDQALIVAGIGAATLERMAA